MRRRGENLKLRVPLLLPVTRKELRAIAGEYGLGKVLAAVQPEAAGAVEKVAVSRQRGLPFRRWLKYPSRWSEIMVQTWRKRLSRAGATRVVEDGLAAALGGVEGPVAVSVEDAGETAMVK